MDLSGRPAHIQDRGMQLEGPAIHFDRGQNLGKAGIDNRPQSLRPGAIA